MYFHPKDEYIYYRGDCDIKQRLTDRSASHFGRFAPQIRPMGCAICSLWEQIHNPNFKPIEFDRFKAESGDNAFTLTSQQWINATDAIGIVSKSGRYGGTYAHTDIAFEFASWISPE